MAHLLYFVFIFILFFHFSQLVQHFCWIFFSALKTWRRQLSWFLYAFEALPNDIRLVADWDRRTHLPIRERRVGESSGPKIETNWWKINSVCERHSTEVVYVFTASTCTQYAFYFFEAESERSPINMRLSRLPTFMTKEMMIRSLAVSTPFVPAVACLSLVRNGAKCFVQYFFHISSHRVHFATRWCRLRNFSCTRNEFIRLFGHNLFACEWERISGIVLVRGNLHRQWHAQVYRMDPEFRASKQKKSLKINLVEPEVLHCSEGGGGGSGTEIHYELRNVRIVEELQDWKWSDVRRKQMTTPYATRNRCWDKSFSARIRITRAWNIHIRTQARRPSARRLSSVVFPLHPTECIRKQLLLLSAGRMSVFRLRPPSVERWYLPRSWECVVCAVPTWARRSAKGMRDEWCKEFPLPLPRLIGVSDWMGL